jgi:hypothetical protein
MIRFKVSRNFHLSIRENEEAVKQSAAGNLAVRIIDNGWILTL